jgi:hypothetical protein
MLWVNKTSEVNGGIGVRSHSHHGEAAFASVKDHEQTLSGTSIVNEVRVMRQERFNNLLSGLMWSMVIIFSGCASTHDVVSDKKESSGGISKVYPVNADQAWEIGKVVFRWEGRHVTEEHKDQGYMLSSSGVGLVAWGTVIGAWFEPVDAENTRVTIIIKRRITATPPASMLKEDSFHHLFAEAVEIVEKGEPLPLKAPN